MRTCSGGGCCTRTCAASRTTDGRDCDGAITAIWGGTLGKRILAQSRHTVSCSANADPAVVPIVCSDDRAIGTLAARAPDGLPPRALRLLRARLARLGRSLAGGFAEALKAGGFSCSPCPVRWPRSYEWTDRPHWPALIEWLNELPKPVGILAMDDAAAHDLAGACVAAKLSVPDRVAIIGVNNDDLLCDSAWPPLSSVATEPSRLGFRGGRPARSPHVRQANSRGAARDPPAPDRRGPPPEHRRAGGRRSERGRGRALHPRPRLRSTARWETCCGTSRSGGAGSSGSSCRTWAAPPWRRSPACASRPPSACCCTPTSACRRSPNDAASARCRRWAASSIKIRNRLLPPGGGHIDVH